MGSAELFPNWLADGADNYVKELGLLDRFGEIRRDAQPATPRDILRLTGRDESLVRHVPDRPGHDRRYAMNASKVRGELGWRPRRDFGEGLAETVAWYRDNRTWWERVRSGAYRDYYERQYGDRLRGAAEGRS